MDIKNGKFIETKHKDNERIHGQFVNGERHGQFLHEDLSGNKMKEVEWVNGKLIYQ
jgi:hypothetical protein